MASMFGAVTASAVLLGGCAPAAPSEQRSDQVDLIAAVWGGASRGNPYQEVLNNFAASREGVTATMEFVDTAPYYERLSANAAARKLPDVFWLNDINFGRYATNGVLLDLAPYLGEQIDTTELEETWLPYGQVDGVTYGIPSHFNGQAVITDQRIFDEQNESYDAKTWDEMFAIARRMTRPDEQKWGLEDHTLGVTQRGFELWVRQHGQELFTGDGQLGFTKEVLIDWWTMWADLRADRVIPPPDVQIESEAQGATTSLLTHGKVAIRLSSSTHLSSHGNLRDGGLAIHDYPAFDGAAEDWRMYNAFMLVIGGNTEAPELAAELIDVLVNDTESAEITKLSMGIPTSTTVSGAITPLLDPADQQAISYLTRQLDHPSRPAPLLPETSEQLIGALSRASQEIAYGRTTPEAGADALFADSERYLG